MKPNKKNIKTKKTKQNGKKKTYLANNEIELSRKNFTP
jgi:hypothetical protein